LRSIAAVEREFRAPAGINHPRRLFRQALLTNNIDMSSNESSGPSAEATATNPAPSADISFGSTRGSGLARGKAKRPSTPAASSAAPSNYTPTAIEVVTAPREYQNPFAPVEEKPVAVTPEPAPVVAHAPTVFVPPARVQQAEAVAPIVKEEHIAPSVSSSPIASDPISSEQSGLNILPPEQPKATPAQTWESEGFRPARESRTDRPRREDAPRREESSRREEPRAESAPFDPSTIPAKFLYVRPGYNYVPTPSNYGGAPRERNNRPAVSAPHSTATSAAKPAEPQSGGGFFGWLKSLFGGSPETPAPVEVPSSEARTSERAYNGNRNRPDGGEGQRRRSRGGRGRSQRSGEYRGGGNQRGDRNSDSSDSSAT
jgi:translation initiation factor IF-2